MDDERSSNGRLFPGPAGTPIANGHPGIDLIFYFFDYVVQIFSALLASPLKLYPGGDASRVELCMLLFTAGLLASELAMECLDRGALSNSGDKLLRTAWFGLEIMAVGDFLLCGVLMFLSAQMHLKVLAWRFCLVSSVIAPLFLIAYQAGQFFAAHASDGHSTGRHFSA